MRNDYSEYHVVRKVNGVFEKNPLKSSLYITLNLICSTVLYSASQQNSIGQILGFFSVALNLILLFYAIVEILKSYSKKIM